MKTVSRFKILGELATFLWHNKRWWLIPVIIIVVIVGVLLIIPAVSSFLPFIYPLF
jgi:competence protein ComGC